MTDHIRAITFDARGTLLRVRFPVGETYAAVARRHGAELSTEAIQAAFFDVFPGMPPLAFPPMSDEALTKHPENGRACRRAISAPAIAGKWSDMKSKSALSNKNLERLGLTKYEKRGDGLMERTAGKDGPREITRD